MRQQLRTRSVRNLAQQTKESVKTVFVWPGILVSIQPSWTGVGRSNSNLKGFGGRAARPTQGRAAEPVVQGGNVEVDSGYSSRGSDNRKVSVKSLCRIQLNADRKAYSVPVFGRPSRVRTCARVGNLADKRVSTCGPAGVKDARPAWWIPLQIRQGHTNAQGGLDCKLRNVCL
jgi:hypothetical protein